MKVMHRSPKERPMETDQHAFDECSDTPPTPQSLRVFDQVDWRMMVSSSFMISD